MRTIHHLVGTALAVRAELDRPSRDERGLSQSTEQAILLAAAVAVALLIVGAVTTLVNSKLPEIKA